jgi:hypothetical protein
VAGSTSTALRTQPRAVDAPPLRKWLQSRLALHMGWTRSVLAHPGPSGHPGHPGDLGKLPPRTGWIARSPYRGVVVWARLWRFVHAREKDSAPTVGDLSERASVEHDRGVALPGSCRGAPEELDPSREARPGPRSIVGGETVVASATRRSASTLAAPRGHLSKATAASSAYEQGAENARMIGVPVSVDHQTPCYA